MKCTAIDFLQHPIGAGRFPAESVEKQLPPKNVIYQPTHVTPYTYLFIPLHLENWLGSGYAKYYLKNSPDSISAMIKQFIKTTRNPFQYLFQILLSRFKKVAQIYQLLNGKLEAYSQDLDLPVLLGRSQTGPEGQEFCGRAHELR